MDLYNTCVCVLLKCTFVFPHGAQYAYHVCVDTQGMDGTLNINAPGIKFKSTAAIMVCAIDSLPAHDTVSDFMDYYVVCVKLVNQFNGVSLQDIIKNEVLKALGTGYTCTFIKALPNLIGALSAVASFPSHDTNC